MDLPFNTHDFLNVFRAYNTAIWPAQVAAYLIGLVTVGHVIWKTGSSGRLVGIVLALFWLWNGAVYHLIFFSTINAAAIFFGSAFIVQGCLFLIAATGRRRLDVRMGSDAYGITGAVLIAYALAVYPVLGTVLGHGYPYAPVFGVAPCPTTIFTFGLLLWARGRIPAWLLVIPLLWSLVGATAALSLGIREDAGLLVAGLLGTSMILYRSRSAPRRRRAAVM